MRTEMFSVLFLLLASQAAAARAAAAAAKQAAAARQAAAACETGCCDINREKGSNVVRQIN